jgi:hypothetical protein
VDGAPFVAICNTLEYPAARGIRVLKMRVDQFLVRKIRAFLGLALLHVLPGDQARRSAQYRRYADRRNRLGVGASRLRRAAVRTIPTRWFRLVIPVARTITRPSFPAGSAPAPACWAQVSNSKPHIRVL